MRTRVLTFVLLFGSAAAGTPAFAAPPSFLVVERAASDRADELVKRGLSLAKADQQAQAEALLNEAWSLKRSWDIAGNLGIVELALGKRRDAAEHLTYAFKTFPSNGKPEQKALLEQTLAKALGQVSTLTIKVVPNRAEVFVDGKSMGTAPLTDAVFVDPGARMVEARLAGYETATATVDAPKGGANEVVLELKKEAPVTAPPPPPVKEGWRPGVAVLVTGGVLAAAGLATGIGLTAAANGKSADADAIGVRLGGPSACTAMPSTTDCKAVKDALTAQGNLSNAAVGAFVAGGTLAVATAVLGTWSAVSKKDATGVRLLPAVGAHEGGIVVVGSW